MKEEKLYALVDQELRGELPQEERSLLEQWLGQDSANRAVYEEVRTILTISGEPFAALDPATDQQFARLMDELNLEVIEEPTPVVDFRPRRRRWIAVAASIVLLAVIGGIFALNYLDAPSDQTMAEIVVPVKEQRSAKLPDGTQVTLNADSRLRLAEGFNKQERRVILEGEAFFDVARDEKRPFIIESKHAETRVLGTSFNICAYPEQENVRIDVASGRVEFKSMMTDETKVLVAHEAAMCMRNGQMKSMDETDVMEAEWRQGVLKFRKTPLKDAVVRIEKHYDLEFEVDEAVADLPLVATYPLAQFDAPTLLKNLGLVLEDANIEWQEGRREVRISKQ